MRRQWNEFKIKVAEEARMFCQATMRSTAHFGRTMLFWEDRWLDGRRVQEIASRVYELVTPRARGTRLVSATMENGSWAIDLRPNFGPDTLQEFLSLWQTVNAWEATEDLPDGVAWSWEANGQFSVRSAYAAGFWGREVISTANLTWKSRAPLQCRFFTWLAMKDRCWTSDRLARRGLPHQDACPFYDQEEETTNHILLTCVFARTTWAAFATRWANQNGPPFPKTYWPSGPLIRGKQTI